MITQMPSVLIKLKKMKVKTKGSHIWIKIHKSIMPLTPICFTLSSKEKRIVRPQKFHMPNKREILAKGVQKQAKGKP